VEVRPKRKLLISVKSTRKETPLKFIQYKLPVTRFKSFHEMKQGQPTVRMLMEKIDNDPKQLFLPKSKFRIVGAYLTSYPIAIDWFKRMRRPKVTKQHATNKKIK